MDILKKLQYLKHDIKVSIFTKDPIAMDIVADVVIDGHYIVFSNDEDYRPSADEINAVDIQIVEDALAAQEAEEIRIKEEDIKNKLIEAENKIAALELENNKLKEGEV